MQKIRSKYKITLHAFKEIYCQIHQTLQPRDPSITLIFNQWTNINV